MGLYYLISGLRAFRVIENINLSRGAGTAGAIAPTIFASSSTLAPPIFAGSSTSWGCYSSPNFFDLPAGLLSKIQFNKFHLILKKLK